MTNSMSDQGLPVTAEDDVERGVTADDKFILYPSAEDRVTEKEPVDMLSGGVSFHHGRIWKADAIVLVDRAFRDGVAAGRAQHVNAYAPGEREELISALRKLLASNENSFTGWPATLGQVEARNAAVAALAKAERSR